MRKIKRFGDGNVLEPTLFDLWSPDSALYNPSYGKRFSTAHWNNLNDFLLYNPLEITGRYLKIYGPMEEASGTIFERYRDAVNLNFINANNNCLTNAYGWQLQVATLYGVPSLRSLTDQYFVMNPNYRMKARLKGEDGKWTDNYEYDNFLSSWNLARGIAASPNREKMGKIIDIKLYLNGREWNDDMYLDFPMGTFFNIGDAGRSDKKYIDPSYGRRDENGNLYPSHSYVLSTFIKDSDTGKIIPILNSSGRSESSVSYYPKTAPIYAIIPAGSEHLTVNNINPRKRVWESHYDPIDKKGFTIYNDNTANERFVRFVDLNELDRLRKVYGITGDLTPIMLRLLAIGAHESNLDNTLNGKHSIYSKRNLGKHWIPDWILALRKDSERGSTPRGKTEKELDELQKKVNEQYDTKLAWQHEIDIYRDLANKGALKGKTLEEVNLLVRDAYNEMQATWNAEHGNENFGKLPYNIRTISDLNRKMSKTAFQMKPGEDFYETDENGNIIPSTRSNVDDQYKGEKETLKAANRLFSLMREIKHKYPKLTDELLLDAATIAWSSPSKINNPDFIDFYIRERHLNDSYLSKVTNRLKMLYGTKATVKEYLAHTPVPLVLLSSENKLEVLYPDWLGMLPQTTYLSYTYR